MPHRLAELEPVFFGAHLGLLLVQSDERDLRMSEASGRHCVVIDNVFVANNVLDRRDAVRRRRVREHHLAIRVADAPQIGHNIAVGLVKHAHLLVHLNEGARSSWRVRGDVGKRARLCPCPRALLSAPRG